MRRTRSSIYGTAGNFNLCLGGAPKGRADSYIVADGSNIGSVADADRCAIADGGGSVRVCCFSSSNSITAIVALGKNSSVPRDRDIGTTITSTTDTGTPFRISGDICLTGDGYFAAAVRVAVAVSAADTGSRIARCFDGGISGNGDVFSIALISAADAGSIVARNCGYVAAGDGDIAGIAIAVSKGAADTSRIIVALCKETALAAVRSFVVVFNCQCARSVTVVFLKTGVLITALQDVVSVQFNFRIAFALYRESSTLIMGVGFTAVNIHIVQHKRKNLLGFFGKVIDNGDDVLGRRCGGAGAAVVRLCCGGSGQQGGRGIGGLLFLFLLLFLLLLFFLLLLLLFLLCGRLLRGLGGFCLCLGRLRGHFLFGWLLLLLLLLFFLFGGLLLRGHFLFGFLFGGLLLRSTLFALPGGCGYLLRCSVPGGILALGRFRLVPCGGVAPVRFLRGGGSVGFGAVVILSAAGSAPDDDAVKAVGVGLAALFDGDYTGIADVNIHTAIIDVVGGRECGGRNGCHNGQHRCCRKHPQCKILRSHKQSSQKLHGVDL